MAELVEWRATPAACIPCSLPGSRKSSCPHHPFLDGNGRTGRLLSTLWLYRSGYDFKRLFTISEHYDSDRSAYYEAMRSGNEADADHAMARVLR